MESCWKQNAITSITSVEKFSRKTIYRTVRQISIIITTKALICRYQQISKCRLNHLLFSFITLYYATFMLYIKEQICFIKIERSLESSRYKLYSVDAERKLLINSFKTNLIILKFFLLNIIMLNLITFNLIKFNYTLNHKLKP